MLLDIAPAVRAVAPALFVRCTTRRGGVSPPPYHSLNLGAGTGDREGNVRENRRRLLHRLGLPARRVARGEQVHGTHIATVRRGGVYRRTDGLITATRGIALAISTADCYPVILYAPSERVLAALHVGRGGARHGIIPAALAAMQRERTIDLPHTIAIVGPGICKRCYTLDGETVARFPGRYVRTTRRAHRLDLAAVIADQLLAGGVRRRNIFRTGLCTSCNPDLFYSHRRDGGVTGRHWTLAMFDRSP